MIFSRYFSILKFSIGSNYVFIVYNIKKFMVIGTAHKILKTVPNDMFLWKAF